MVVLNEGRREERTSRSSNNSSNMSLSLSLDDSWKRRGEREVVAEDDKEEMFDKGEKKRE